MLQLIYCKSDSLRTAGSHAVAAAKLTVCRQQEDTWSCCKSDNLRTAGKHAKRLNISANLQVFASQMRNEHKKMTNLLS